MNTAAMETPIDVPKDMTRPFRPHAMTDAAPPSPRRSDRLVSLQKWLQSAISRLETTVVEISVTPGTLVDDGVVILQVHV